MSTTRTQMLKKLVALNKEIPITTQKLKKEGISSFLARKYKDNGWIESLGVGAFKFPKGNLTIEGVLHALQIDLSLNVYPGAKTALEMAGVRQYYREKEKIYLFTNIKTYLPLWARNYKYERELRIIKSSKWDAKEFLFSPNTKDFDFFIASKELAIVQQIELIGEKESFEETAQLFEILDSLDPNLLNKILKRSSNKSKRIFSYFSGFFDHSWWKEINPRSIESGNSVITIEKGGRYLKNYNLIIPRSFNV